MPELAAKARDYAIHAHARINQLRKYTFQPYDVHLKTVADLVAMVTDDEETIAAAWLHDTVEDTPATFEDIEREFGHGVKSLVMELTDISRPGDGNRALRKEIDLDHTAMASARAKTVKLADLIDNCIDICRNDPKFGPVYLQEMVDLMEVLHEGNQRLYRKALKTVDSASRSLGIAVPADRRKVWQPQGVTSAPYEESADQYGRRVFTRSFLARDILEPLLSFDSEHLDRGTLLKSGAGNSSAVGIRIDGKVSGYVLHEDLRSDAPLAARQILRQQTVELDAPLAEVIHILTMFSCCFVTLGGVVSGVISRQDIEKPVVRMWLFGIIILIEMILMKHIRHRWPDEGWL
ncbi:MAG: guanosine polyphosphate pyrophosphohydrolase/synthetase, partial [Deltaproteobacteria bacterium]|nr:guanosine polyphosphate pyrophosphohydrolase/synthetase [Deltaproteobacteria bacterium]